MRFSKAMGGFPQYGVVISFISINGDLINFNYWRLFTKLTTIYEIFAKILHLRLQPMVRNVVSLDQTIFLTLRFKLDDIELIYKSLHWANTSRQPSMFLKLDFSKEYVSLLDILGSCHENDWYK